MPSDDQDDQLLNIVDLPLDILYLIFAHFRRSSSDPPRAGTNRRHECRNYHPNPDEALATIRGARQVCRAFNLVASQFLLPVLRVDLSQASLDRASAVARNSSIAAGVLAVHVGLRYRSSVLADDLKRFTEFAFYSLNVESDMWDLETPEVLSGVDEEGPYQYAPNKDWVMNEVAVKRVKNRIGLVRRAWEKIGTENYRRVLYRAHGEYRRKHEEQTRLISTGSFVDALAAAMTQVSGAGGLSLVFTDTIAGGERAYWSDEWRHKTKEDLMETWTDGDQLLEYLSFPHCWSTIETRLEPNPHHQLDWRIDDEPPESYPPGAQHLPTRIMSELPIAMHSEDVRLRKMKICIFPKTTGLTSLRPRVRDPRRLAIPSAPDAGWQSLRAACQHLKSFNFGKGGNLSGRDIRVSHPESEAQECINSFFSAVLSSSLLEDVRISMHSFGLNPENRPVKDYYHFGTVLGTTPTWPRIRSLHLLDVAATETELVQLFGNLGTRQLEHISFHDITLAPGGNWDAPGFDRHDHIPIP
ncbi:hypothetical protein GE09DRAFT_1294580 [Coniochaeta sp. 2T2.1]|nr:hypothetical protein GE09DRAFT_1294580 [Coniochaeta sp. 2T2.1]